MVSILELDFFLNTNCLNLDLLGLLHTLMLSLNLAAWNSFAKEIYSFFIGWNIVSSDMRVSPEIILMTWVVLTPVVVSLLWSKFSAMNCQNLFSDSNSLLLTKSLNFHWIQQHIYWTWVPPNMKLGTQPSAIHPQEVLIATLREKTVQSP